jgi:hypothetical protein
LKPMIKLNGTLGARQEQMFLSKLEEVYEQ